MQLQARSLVLHPSIPRPAPPPAMLTGPAEGPAHPGEDLTGAWTWVQEVTREKSKQACLLSVALPC